MDLRILSALLKIPIKKSREEGGNKGSRGQVETATRGAACVTHSFPFCAVGWSPDRPTGWTWVVRCEGDLRSMECRRLRCGNGNGTPKF
jgi:hypothetical protein